jgi:hypothetical protein
VLRRHLVGGAEQGGADRRSSRGLAKPERDILSGSTSRPLSRDVCRLQSENATEHDCDQVKAIVLEATAGFEAVVAAGLVGAGLLSFSVERWLKQFLQHRIQQWRVTARFG